MPSLLSGWSGFVKWSPAALQITGSNFLPGKSDHATCAEKDAVCHLQTANAPGVAKEGYIPGKQSLKRRIEENVNKNTQ